MFGYEQQSVLEILYKIYMAQNKNKCYSIQVKYI